MKDSYRGKRLGGSNSGGRRRSSGDLLATDQLEADGNLIVPGQRPDAHELRLNRRLDVLRYRYEVVDIASEYLQQNRLTYKLTAAI